MSHNPRKFQDAVRLIVNIERETVDAIDRLMESGHAHHHRNRAEFIRQAIEAELERMGEEL